ncbi:DUF485 domain-containing protein [Streptomyces boluensis]|uniref:DUF485 domain-containing protein n=1 Tax=Streptomyces boluensis TaxID=1775135 RepID=A0A964UL89_9ACTN|nr:DUF485 domain-containing protein [Streptomyces boluensis]NBE51131.1 DUF485 domain-containing protein [Streptomyces boluensis]
MFCPCLGARPKCAADEESSVEKHEDRVAGRVRLSDPGGLGDPWRDASASGWGELDGTGAPASALPHARGVSQQADQKPTTRAADIYLEVQGSPAFQEVRRRYRRFVVPACAAFFAWYVAYVVAATAAPDLMARPVAGAVNVAMVAGLGQFLSTFLLTWAYARHARLRRDHAALELRWDTQELTRGVQR